MLFYKLFQNKISCSQFTVNNNLKINHKHKKYRHIKKKNYNVKTEYFFIFPNNYLMAIGNYTNFDLIHCSYTRLNYKRSKTFTCA